MPPVSRGPLRIAVVDDCDLSVAGLRTLLAPYAGRVELLDLAVASGESPGLDVVLHEPHQRASSSSSLLADLLARSGALAIAYTWDPDAADVQDGGLVLPKSMTASQLVRALEDAVEGRYVPAPRRVPAAAPAHQPSQSAASGTETAPRDTTATAGLTVRERQVLVLITRGMSNPEISEEIGLSINSVKTYVRSAYRKLGVTRRTQAVSWGINHGLLTEPATATAPAEAEEMALAV